MHPAFIDPQTSRLLDKHVKQLYVYVDYTLEASPRPFYVGQGNYNRVRSPRRNGLHSAITVQHGLKRVLVTAVSTIAEANELEVKLIAEHGTQHNAEGRWGANKARGGRGTNGYKHTPEAVENMCQSQRKRWRSVVQYALNGTMVATFPSLISAERQTGVYGSNIRKCCQRLLKSSGGFVWRDVGDTFDPKFRAKMPPNRKPTKVRGVTQLELDGAIVQTYPSIREAYQATGIANIVRCCRNVSRTAGGYRWRYAT